jgi:Polyketide synthase dehydratase
VHTRTLSESPSPSVTSTAEPSVSLLGNQVSSPLDVTQFHAELSTELHPSLADVVWDGINLVSAGFYLEAAVQAAERTRGVAAVGVEGLVCSRALRLPEDGRLTTELILTNSCGPRSTFSYRSKHGNTGEWATHAQGIIISNSKPTSRMDLDAIIARCPEEVDLSAFFYGLLRRKIYLARSAAWATKMVRRDGEALGWFRAADQSELRQGYHLHPGIIESSLQVLFASIPSEKVESIMTMLVEVDEYSFYEYDGSPLLCHVMLEDSDATTGIFSGDITFETHAGVPVAHMAGVKEMITTHSTVEQMVNSTPVSKVPVQVAGDIMSLASS